MKTIFFINNAAKGAKEQNSIVLRFYLKSLKKYKVKGLGINCTKKDWNQDSQRIKRSHPHYVKFNNKLTFIENELIKVEEKGEVTAEDIDMLIPHQANLRIAQFVQKKFGLTDDQVFNNIQKYGNTTAASIPIALTEAWEKGKVKEGDTVVLAAFGSGFTWASSIIKW